MHSSQYGEHVFILEHFAGRTGRFLDVGAYDGLNFSNTRQLMEIGWSGVCVEPSPMVFPYLCENTDKFSLVQCLQAAVIPDDFQGNGKMWVTQDALSTLVKSHRDIITVRNPLVPYTEVHVPILKWQEFLKVYPEPYDFINIDVEGMNWEILRDGPMAEMICIEMDPADMIPKMKEHLKLFGLGNQKEIGGNLLAWR